jgi:hypothetical protein
LHSIAFPRVDSNRRDLGLQQDNSDNLQRYVIFIFSLIQLFDEKVFIPTQRLLLAESVTPLAFDHFAWWTILFSNYLI